MIKQVLLTLALCLPILVVQAEEPKAKPESEPQEELSINITYEQFKERFEKISTTEQGENLVGELTITKSADVDDSNETNLLIKVGNGTIMMMTANQLPDKKLTRLVLLASGDGTPVSGAKIMVGLVAMIGAFNPELENADERFAFLKNKLSYEKALNGEMVELEHEGILYTITTNEMIGLVFTLAPAK